jgi:F-type H+-transporting ATPase subunit epsilon
MQCTVRSVDRTVFEGEADRIVARTPHGEFAVLNGHAPLVAVLVPGVIRLHVSGTEQILVTRGGTLELADGRAVLLVERPYPLEEIDTAVLREEIDSLRNKEEAEDADAREAEYLELLCRVKESHD